VTQKGQGHDANIFGAHYLDNGWRYRLGANREAIGNDYLGIKWSRDRRRHLTLKGQGRASIHLGPNILKTDGDRDLGPMGHQ